MVEIFRRRDFLLNPDRLSPAIIGLSAVFVSLALFSWLVALSIPWYVFMLGFSYLILMAFVFIRFEYGAYLLLFLVPFSGNNIGFAITSRAEHLGDFYFVDRIPLSVPIILCSSLGLLFARWSDLKGPSVRNPLFFPSAILLGYGLITLSYVPSFDHSAIQFCILTTNILLFSLLFTVASDRTKHKRIMWCFISSGLLQALLVISSYFIARSGLLHHAYKLTGFLSFVYEFNVGYQAFSAPFARRGEAFANCNETALMMNVFLSVAVALFLTEEKRRQKVFIGIVMVILLIAHTLTMSRTGTIALLIMTFFLLGALKKLRRHFIIIGTAFIILVASIGMMENRLLMNALEQGDKGQSVLFQERMVSQSTKGITTSRLLMWKSGLYQVMSKGMMLSGLGVGGTQIYLAEPHTHNLYLSFLFDLGLAGAGVMLWIIIVLLRKNLGLIRFQDSYAQIMNAALIGALIALGGHGFVDFEYNRPFVWVIFALVLSTAHLAHKELEAFENQIQQKRI
jgi:O-antigen ligase